MQPNLGELPPHARGKRVRVKLRNGALCGEPVNSYAPPGWAADGRQGCDWRITGSPFDILEWELVR